MGITQIQILPHPEDAQKGRGLEGPGNMESPHPRPSSPAAVAAPQGEDTGKRDGAFA